MKLKKKTEIKRKKRLLRHNRGRKKLSGSTEKPRLNIFKGSTSLVAQVIDDSSGRTILGLSTKSKAVEGDLKGSNIKAAEKLGEAVGALCREKSVDAVIFDKGGYKYHGVIKAFADAVRKSGVKF